MDARRSLPRLDLDKDLVLIERRLAGHDVAPWRRDLGESAYVAGR
jgi:hypothetical protein